MHHISLYRLHFNIGWCIYIDIAIKEDEETKQTDKESAKGIEHIHDDLVDIEEKEADSEAGHAQSGNDKVENAQTAQSRRGMSIILVYHLLCMRLIH